MFTVGSYVSVEDTFKPVVVRLKVERCHMPRMIIYGRTYSVCADIFLFFKKEIGENITEPTESPDLAAFRLVDVFTSVTDSTQKEAFIHIR